MIDSIIGSDREIRRCEYIIMGTGTTGVYRGLQVKAVEYSSSVIFTAICKGFVQGGGGR